MIDARRATCGGFTLIELVIVVMLITVITAVAAPRLADQIGGARVRKAARDFCSLARLARSKAAAEVRDYGLILEPAAGRMVVRPVKAREALGSSLLRRRLPDGVRVQAVGASGSAGAGGADLVFRPDGTASKARVVFRDGTGRRLEVQVDEITGRTTVTR